MRRADDDEKKKTQFKFAKIAFSSFVEPIQFVVFMTAVSTFAHMRTKTACLAHQFKCKNWRKKEIVERQVNEYFVLSKQAEYVVAKMPSRLHAASLRVK